MRPRPRACGPDRGLDSRPRAAKAPLEPTCTPLPSRRLRRGTAWAPARPPRHGSPRRRAPARTLTARPRRATAGSTAARPDAWLSDLLGAAPPAYRRRRGLGTARPHTWRGRGHPPARLQPPPMRWVDTRADRRGRSALRPRGLATPLPRPHARGSRRPHGPTRRRRTSPLAPGDGGLEPPGPLAAAAVGAGG